MLIDDVRVTLSGGKGGDGIVSFRHDEGKAKGGPDGGNGGNGGSIYLTGVTDMSALSKFQYKKELKAEDGVSGRKKTLFGRNGEDLLVPLPLGTMVVDEETGKSFEIRKTTDKVVIAKGGIGGRGNDEFKSATNQTPRIAEKGTLGESKHLHLILRLIAQIGLIGLPNAGKSSLLAVLTNANPKIGNYPFTTLEPNLGAFDTSIIADIPGLIEGAHIGKGLGTKFLKHIEKTKILFHCISSENEDVKSAYNTVQSEFKLYNPKLLEKPQIILLTKTDLSSESEIEKKKKTLKKHSDNVIGVSVYDDESIKQLEILLRKYL
jgi:GTP-binding protein